MKIKQSWCTPQHTAKREWDCDIKISVPTRFPQAVVVWAAQLPLCPMELANSCGSCWWPILECFFILIPRARGGVVVSLLGAVALPGHRKAACLLNLAFTYCDCKFINISVPRSPGSRRGIVYFYLVRCLERPLFFYIIQWIVIG